MQQLQESAAAENKGSDADRMQKFRQTLLRATSLLAQLPDYTTAETSFVDMMRRVKAPTDKASGRNLSDCQKQLEACASMDSWRTENAEGELVSSDGVIAKIKWSIAIYTVLCILRNPEIHERSGASYRKYLAEISGGLEMSDALKTRVAAALRPSRQETETELAKEEEVKQSKEKKREKRKKKKEKS